MSLVDYRVAVRQLDGQDAGAEPSPRKLIGVAAPAGDAELAYELTGDPELLHGFRSAGA